MNWRHYMGVYPAQISEWKKCLVESAESIFATSQKKDIGLQKKLDDLHRTAGEITMERDWLKKSCICTHREKTQADSNRESGFFYRETMRLDRASAIRLLPHTLSRE